MFRELKDLILIMDPLTDLDDQLESCESKGMPGYRSDLYKSMVKTMTELRDGLNVVLEKPKHVIEAEVPSFFEIETGSELVDVNGRHYKVPKQDYNDLLERRSVILLGQNGDPDEVVPLPRLARVQPIKRLIISD